MKIVRGSLIILGILLLLVGLGLTYIMATRGPTIVAAWCGFAERDKKDADEAKKRYEASKGTIKETELQTASEKATRTAYVSQITCDEEKSGSSFRFIISLLVLGLGVLLSIVGFFVGRKKTIP